MQTALLEHAAAYNLRTVMTFHQKVEEAAAFAEKLPETAAELYSNDASDDDLAAADRLPKSSIDAEFYELEAGRHVPPDRVWSAWLCGDHLVSERREVLRQFANGIDAAGRRVHRAFLASVRVLGEGVDITGERGVEAICFADTRGSQVEIVQNIGRALRLNKDGSTKIARIIVPVFLQPGEDPTDMVASASFRPLVAVLQGLRAHDEEAVELLAIPQEPQKDMAQPSVNIGAAPEEGGEESRLLLRFAAPRDPVMVAEWVSFNVIDTEKQDWARGWAKLKAYTGREGHARVPYGHKEGAYPLGQWVAEQRRAYGAGQMTGKRARRLEKLGMVWSPADERFQENLEAAKAYYDQHWTLCAPRTATALDRPIGQWLSNLRRPGALDDHPEWEAALKAVDEHWNPAWPADWQRHYAALRELVRDEDGQADVLPGLTVHGMDIGRWLAKQRQHTVWTGLMDAQRELLEAIGVTPLPPEQETPAIARKGGSGAFERGVAALAQYKTRTGSLTVPRSHVETVVVDGQEHTVKLGVFLSNTKTRRAKLGPDKLAALADLGLEWATV
ncbi:Helicase associated domain protein [Streptomyces sp. NPDC056309]